VSLQPATRYEAAPRPPAFLGSSRGSIPLDLTSSVTVLEQLGYRPAALQAPAVVTEWDDCPLHPDQEALFVQFQPLVRRLLQHYGKTPELRNDLTGEIYYQFCRAVAAYDPARGIPICVYLPRMLSQRMLNYVRDNWRVESFEAPLETSAGETSESQSAVPAEDWNETLAAKEVRGALPSALARLPHRQRLVLVWRYYEGFRVEQIAEQMQVEPAAVRSLLRHGIAALRRQLAPEASAGV